MGQSKPAKNGVVRGWSGDSSGVGIGAVGADGQRPDGQRLEERSQRNQASRMEASIRGIELKLDVTQKEP